MSGVHTERKAVEEDEAEDSAGERSGLCYRYRSGQGLTQEAEFCPMVTVNHKWNHDRL